MLKSLLRRHLELLERYTGLREKAKSAAPAAAPAPAPTAEASALPPPQEALFIEEAAHQTHTHVIYEGVRATPASENPPMPGTAEAALKLEELSEQIQMQSRRYPRVLSSDGEQI